MNLNPSSSNRTKKILSRCFPSHLAGMALLALSFATPGAAKNATAVEAAPQLFDQKDQRSLGLPKLPSKQVKLYVAKKDNYKYSHHPMITVFRNTLYAMWSTGAETEDSPSQYVVYATSQDGLIWSEPKALAPDPDGPLGERRLVAGGWLVEKSTIYAIFSEFTIRQGNLERVALRARRSDDGKIWEEIYTGAPAVILNQSPFFAGGGRYLFPGFAINGAQVFMAENWDTPRCRFNKSPNFHAPAGVDLTEPNIFRQKNGKLTCVFRDNNSSSLLYASTSRDKTGRDWSGAEPTNFPDSSARARIGTLPNGAYWMLSNPSATHGRRIPLVISLSPDGKVFDHAFVVRNEDTVMKFPNKTKGAGFQYPDAVVFEGRMYVIYSVNKEDIEISVLNLSDLTAK